MPTILLSSYLFIILYKGFKEYNIFANPFYLMIIMNTPRASSHHFQFFLTELKSEKVFFSQRVFL